MKKLKFWLSYLDGLWSVPLAFFAFWAAGILLGLFGGYGTGTYDLGFIQPLFLAGAVVIGATNMTIWGLYFTFRGLHRYLYGQKKDPKYPAPEKPRINYSKIDWLKLKEWQRYIVSFLVFFFFFFAILIVYLKLV